MLGSRLCRPAQRPHEDHPTRGLARRHGLQAGRGELCLELGRRGPRLQRRRALVRPPAPPLSLSLSPSFSRPLSSGSPRADFAGFFSLLRSRRYVFGMMQNRTMPDESCQPYLARNEECSPVCTNCDPGTDTCFPVSYVGYGVHSFWQVRGKRQVAREIYENGPVTCSFVSTEEFMYVPPPLLSLSLSLSGSPLADFAGFFSLLRSRRYNFSTNAQANDGVFVDDRKYPKSMVDHDIELVRFPSVSKSLVRSPALTPRPSFSFRRPDGA